MASTSKNQQATPRQLEVLAAISRFEGRQCYSPTIAELASELNVSRTTVFEHIAGLRGKELLTGSKGRARSSRLTAKARRLLEEYQSTVEVAPVDNFTGINLLGAEACAIRYCTVRASYGIRASRPPGARNCYVADNVLEGPSVWISEAMGARGDNLGEGVQLTGPGNVICYNRVRGFRDCISTMESQNVEDQICVDIYHNDVYLGADDGIEADYCYNNCRIVRNRLTNCFVGVSSQPGLGGPTYFIRNAMYNLTYVPFKFHNRSTGNVALHNTAVKVGDGMACFTGATFDFGYFRNNLCIGGPTDVNWGGYGAGDGLVANMRAPGPHTTFDYDALGSHGLPFHGRIGDQAFESVEEMRKGPHEQHGIQVDMGVFDGVDFPEPPVPERGPADLRPRAGSAVVDIALPLPNVNDAHRGPGPDIGAFEAGQPLPHYGPRPLGVDEATTMEDEK